MPKTIEVPDNAIFFSVVDHGPEADHIMISMRGSLQDVAALVAVAVGKTIRSAEEGVSKDSATAAAQAFANMLWHMLAEDMQEAFEEVPSDA